MIDACSTGSRTYVYTWKARTQNTIPDVVAAPPQQAAWSMKVNPGISTFAASSVNAAAVAAYLQPLIDYAASKIPAAQQSDTPIYLYATAGMRSVDPTYARNLYQVVRAYLLRGPFLFDPTWARTISGEEEGTFGWNAVNMLSQTLNGSV